MTEPADEYGELDETKIFQALDDHGVEYVVVGGSAAILWGAERATRDIDCVAHQTVENHRRLCNALEQMGNPRLRIEGVDDAAAIELFKQLLHPDFFARTTGLDLANRQRQRRLPERHPRRSRRVSLV